MFKKLMSKVFQKHKRRTNKNLGTIHKNQEKKKFLNNT